MAHTLLPLAVSIGEPAGIGPDIAIVTWLRATTDQTIPPFILLADPGHLLDRAEKLGLSIEIAECENSDLALAASDTTNFRKKLPVLTLQSAMKAAPGQSLRDDSIGVIEAISTGVQLIKSECAAGLVTLPINKKSLYDVGFEYPGHTEFLGALADDWDTGSQPHRPVMMLAGPKLKTVPVTIHIPLKVVPNELTAELIVQTARIVDRDLKTRFGISQPRLAFAGLNPHAGEGGALGVEDDAIIGPAIAQLQSEGIECTGPLPADTMFHDAARERYDVALCMYHDQALIPAKTLSFDDGVNVTLGLPFIRTSPDHGTAFDIAGTGRANPESFIAALKMARQMADSTT